MTQHESASLAIFTPVEQPNFNVDTVLTPLQEQLRQVVIMRAHRYLETLEADIDTDFIATAPDRARALSGMLGGIDASHASYTTDETYGYEGVWHHTRSLFDRKLAIPAHLSTEVTLTSPLSIDPRANDEMQTAAQLLMRRRPSIQAPLAVRAGSLFGVKGTRNGLFRPRYTYDEGPQQAALSRAVGNELCQREDLRLCGRVVLQGYFGGHRAATEVLTVCLGRGLMERTDTTPTPEVLKRAAVLLRLKEASNPVV